jgi:hypothetical protein
LNINPKFCLRNQNKHPSLLGKQKQKQNKTKQNTQAQMWGFGKYTPKKTSFLQEGGKK